MKTKIEVRHLGIVIKVAQQSPARYVIPDYSTGQRVRHVRTTKAEAVAQAKLVCEALASGKKDERELIVDDELRFEFRRAKEILQPTSLRLTKAAQVVTDCCQFVTVDEIVEACRHYRDTRPRKGTPKQVNEAVTEFLASQENKLSKGWHRALSSYAGTFKKAFSGKELANITTGDLEAVIETKGWSPKTHNSFLDVVSLIYKYAASGNRNWVVTDYNPAKKVERRTVKGLDIGIFEAWEARQMLERLESDYAELIPFVALWCFSGLRKEEISRLSWQQLQAGLKTGHIDLLAKQAKTGVARSVPVLPNAKAWLLWWETKHGKQETGMMIPANWSSVAGLSRMTKVIAAASGVAWKDNGPRHSYATYRSKALGNVVTVADEMGNSPVKIERNYRRKSVELETAQAWFDVMPPQVAENVLPMVAEK